MTPLRKLRKQKKGLAGTSIALAIGIDASHYYGIEKGTSTASPELAEKISRYFGGAITELQILYPERFMPQREPNQ